MNRRYSTLTAVVLCLALVAQAESVRNTRPVSPQEEIQYRSRHEAIKSRLLAVGVQLGMPEEEAAVYALPPQKDSRVVERIGVADKALSTEYDRRTGELIFVSDQRQILARGSESEKGTTYPFVLTENEAREKARLYYCAIENTALLHTSGEMTRCYKKVAEKAATNKQRWEMGISADTQLFETWPRMFNGYPFRDDQVELSISAVDGAFLIFHRFDDSDEPTSLSVKITQDDAIRLAMEAIQAELSARAIYDAKSVKGPGSEGILLGSKQQYEATMAQRREAAQRAVEEFKPFLGVRPETILPITLMIVHPNALKVGSTTIFQTIKYPSDLPRTARPTRLAWVMASFFPLKADPPSAPRGWGRDGPPGLIAEVWIDAENGTALGGNFYVDARDLAVADDYARLNSICTNSQTPTITAPLPGRTPKNVVEAPPPMAAASSVPSKGAHASSAVTSIFIVASVLCILAGVITLVYVRHRQRGNR